MELQRCSLPVDIDVERNPSVQIVGKVDSRVFDFPICQAVQNAAHYEGISDSEIRAPHTDCHQGLEVLESTLRHS